MSFPSQSLSFNLNIVLEMVNHSPSMHKVLSVVSSSASMRVHTYAYTHTLTLTHVTSDTAGLPIFTLAGTTYPQQMSLKLNCIQALASAKLRGNRCIETAKAPLVQHVCFVFWPSQLQQATASDSHWRRVWALSEQTMKSAWVPLVQLGFLRHE